MDNNEDRIALFLDFENLAIGAREDLGGLDFDFKPISDALAERGRVVARRAYADWTMFESARRGLTEHQVELIEIPQKMGATRKNAADIKMAVDAIELAFERDYITTFVICTGDSDFTPLVHKLRELNKRVIGIGLRASTSRLLPPACDEFLFYESLEGVDLPRKRRRGGAAKKADRPAEEPPAAEASGDLAALERSVTQTLSGMQSSGGVVLASTLKRALIRKDPTFTEADYGFRGFGELLKHLADQKVVALTEGPARGDPEVGFPESGGTEEAGFEVLRGVVAAESKVDPVPLSGLKDRLRKTHPGFSEKDYGYRGFLQFTKAAAARGRVSMEWSDEAEDYLLTVD
ncbi:MAG: NYN domain-containing protein [Actinobacteria bacterium]|nr:NYN domain-containing protein [Actinomycetota bacterium]